MPRSPLEFDYIIGGRSFVGQSLALALAQTFGPDTRIALLDHRQLDELSCDQDPCALPPGGRAFALSAASVAMLDVLGVWARVKASAQPVHEICITDSGLEDIYRAESLAYENTIKDGEPASYILQSEILELALKQSVERTGSIEIISNVRSVSLEADRASQNVTLQDGRILSAPLVVAADGRQSPLRKMAGIKLASWSHNQLGIVTQVSHSKPHHGRAIQHFLPSGPFAILPLPNNHVCITWSEGSESAKNLLALNEPDFLSEVAKRFGPSLGELRLVGARQSWPLGTHLARSFVSDRFALIGDAARGVHPIAGQGLNLGLRDVAALTQVVCEDARVGLDVGQRQTLLRYEQWRRFDSVMSSFAFDGLNRLFSNDGAVLRGLRDAGLSVVDRLPVLKQAFVNQAAGVAGDVPKLLRGEMI